MSDTREAAGFNPKRMITLLRTQEETIWHYRSDRISETREPGFFDPILRPGGAAPGHLIIVSGRHGAQIMCVVEMGGKMEVVPCA